MNEIRRELIEKFDSLIENDNRGDIRLNNWEEEFLDSIESQIEAEDGFLTELQIEKLEQIYEKYNK